VPALVTASGLRAEGTLEQPPLSVKGSRGLPRTLFIAPWKRLGEPLAGGNLEGDVGQETEPLERDQLRWELQLYNEGYNVEEDSCPECMAQHPDN
jgi:hypothetical protein